MHVRRSLWWAYVAALHLFFAVVLLKTDLIELVERRLGTYRASEGGQAWQSMVTIQTRVDAQLPPGAVLFFGDSLTAGMFTGRFGANTANYGIGFDTTAGLIRRLPLYRSLPRASAVVMMIGTNDPLFRTVDETIANHRTLLATLRGAPLLVAVGPPPVDDRSPGNEIRGNAALRRIGQALRDSCALETNCRYVDPWPILAPGDVGLPSAFHVGDGLHLNAAGYERLAQVIEAALQGAAR